MNALISNFNKHCEGSCELLRLKHFRELQGNFRGHKETLEIDDK